MQSRIQLMLEIKSEMTKYFEENPTILGARNEQKHKLTCAKNRRKRRKKNKK